MKLAFIVFYDEAASSCRIWAAGLRAAVTQRDDPGIVLFAMIVQW
jgi:hypothetical protein